MKNKKEKEKKVNKKGLIISSAIILVIIVAVSLIFLPKYLSVRCSLRDGVLTISGSGAVTAAPEKGLSKNQCASKLRRIDKSKVEKIIIKDGISEIGNSVFSDDFGNVTEIEIPKSVKKIGAYAFCGCNSIMVIKVPDSVAEIGEGAFRDVKSINYNGKAKAGEYDPDWGAGIVNGYVKGNCIFNDDTLEVLIGVDAKSDSVTIPESVKEISGGAFRGCKKLKKITLPENVDDIGLNAFIGCSSLTEFVVSENNYDFHTVDGVLYKQYGTYTSLILFAYPAGKKETSFTIPDGTEKIYFDAFHGCTNLKEIKIPDTVTEICGCAFEDCVNLEKIVIPNKVTDIGLGCFRNCTSIKNLTIPESVTGVGMHAFEGWTSSQKILIKANTIVWEENWDYECKAKITYNEP